MNIILGGFHSGVDLDAKPGHALVGFNYNELIDSMSADEFHKWAVGKNILEQCVNRLMESKQIEKDALDILREAQEA